MAPLSTGHLGIYITPQGTALFDRFNRPSGFLPCSETARDMCNILQPHLMGNLNRKS